MNFLLLFSIILIFAAYGLNIFAYAMNTWKNEPLAYSMITLNGVGVLLFIAFLVFYAVKASNQSSHSTAGLVVIICSLLLSTVNIFTINQIIDCGEGTLPSLYFGIIFAINGISIGLHAILIYYYVKNQSPQAVLEQFERQREKRIRDLEKKELRSLAEEKKKEARQDKL